MSSLEIWLMMSLGLFIMIQLMNGILNLITAKHLRRRAILEAKAREDEARLIFEKWSQVDVRLIEISEMQTDIEDRLKDHHDYVISFNLDKEPKFRKRGPYGPRKKKTIEHKKTPPEN